MRKIVFGAVIIAGILFSSSVFAENLRELYQEGMRLYQEGEYQKAIESFEKAAKLNSNFAPAYNGLGLAYKELNASPSEVIWYFKSAVDIDPKFAEAYDNLGKAYYGIGQFDKAEEYCKKALEINPRLGSAEFSLAWVYLLGKSQPQEAIPYFKKVLEKSKIPFAYFGLGISYFMIDERALVLEIITSLREMNQDKLAEQLENMIRDYYYIPSESGGSLVKIEPPPETTGEPVAPAESTISQKGEPAKQDLSSFMTRVRMKGSFVNLNEGKASGSVNARTTATGHVKGEAIIQAAPEPLNIPTKNTASSGTLSDLSGDTIEIRKTDRPLGTHY